jgi:predicted GTPase
VSRAQVAQLREDAQWAIKAIDAQPIPDDDSVRAKRDDALATATTLLQLAKEPITIGVVGEFSAGKSLLIGTLLGKPDLLPIQGRATTGNVTALRLIAAGSDANSHADDRIVVEYLSRDQLAKAARHMVGQLAAAALNIPGLDTSPLTEFDSSPDDVFATDKFFAKVRSWCRQLWRTGPTKEEERNPEVKHAAWELLRLGDTVRNAAALIGQSVEVPEKMAETALDLGDREPIPDVFPESSVRILDRAAVQQKPNALQATFLLIRRVVYTVRIPPRVWDLSALRDENEVMLLDFPGLGSEASHNRDEYLCQSELEDVSTILVVLKGDHPGAKGPQKFYSMMQRPGRDRATLAQAILIAGNQFDRVVAPTLPNTEPMDITRITGVSEDLRGFRTTVRDLIDKHEHHCQLTSAIAAMNYYKLSYHKGSPESREKIALAMQEAGPRVTAWGELGRRLEAAHPGDPWGAQLRALGNDGGIGALQALIETHARRRGLGLKAERMDRHQQKMIIQLERLCRAVTTAASPATARQQGLRLSIFFHELVNQLNSVRKRTADFTHFPSAAGGATTGRKSLVEQLRAKAVCRVYEWPQWNDILGRAENFVVPRRPVTVGRKGRIFDDDEWTSADTDTTTVLYQSFQAVVAEIGEMATEQVLATAKKWAEERHHELEPLRERYADEELRDLVERAFDDLDHDPKRRSQRVTALDRALDLMTWLSPAFDDEVDQLRVPDQDITDRFPLRSEHLLPWHARRPVDPDARADRDARHQVEVFRIRHALARAAADLVAEHAVTMLVALGEMVRDEMTRIQRRIPTDIELHRIAPPRVTRGAPPSADKPADDPSSAPVCALLAEWSTRR